MPTRGQQIVDRILHEMATDGVEDIARHQRALADLLDRKFYDLFFWGRIAPALGFLVAGILAWLAHLAGVQGTKLAAALLAVVSFTLILGQTIQSRLPELDSAEIDSAWPLGMAQNHRDHLMGEVRKEKSTIMKHLPVACGFATLAVTILQLFL